jgi:hypothetical protein
MMVVMLQLVAPSPKYLVMMMMFAQLIHVTVQQDVNTPMFIVTITQNVLLTLVILKMDAPMSQ